MSDNLKFVKRYKKSEVYENEDYVVRLITPTNRFVLRKNDPNNAYWYNDELDDGVVFTAEIKVVEIKSKDTGKKATKRVYQDYPIEDIEEDLTKKSQFSDVFKKIDK